jgi:hypothetical protein
MRVFFFLMVLIIAFGFLGFVATNLDTTVDVTVFAKPYEAVPLWWVVGVTLIFIAVLIGSYAIAEGAAARLENRRLRRELHKLETEINYLRTQPSVSSSLTSEPPGPPETAAASSPEDPERVGATEKPAQRDHPPSAPVYGNESDDWSPDPDDDAYSGGRAV